MGLFDLGGICGHVANIGSSFTEIAKKIYGDYIHNVDKNISLKNKDNKDQCK